MLFMPAVIGHDATNKKSRVGLARVAMFIIEYSANRYECRVYLNYFKKKSIIDQKYIHRIVKRAVHVLGFSF